MSKILAHSEKSNSGLLVKMFENQATSKYIFQYLKTQGGHSFVGSIWTSWPWYKSKHTCFSVQHEHV